MTLILAAQHWKNNAELIADVAKLGYLGDDDAWVLDPTYGKGNWWKLYRPRNLIACSNLVNGGHFDFRRMGFSSSFFDAVAFDPPYVCKGGRKTSTLKQMNSAYGLNDAPSTPQELQYLINDGLRECTRVLKPGGFLLVKCQDYVSSGKLWPGTFKTQLAAEGTACLELVDRFEHVSKAPRPQPGERRQVHARRNLSTLLVFKKGTKS